jgi:hypothetical protein
MPTPLQVGCALARAGGAVLVAVAVAVSGCAPENPGQPPSLGSAALDLVTRAGTFPDRYALLDHAEQEATSRCMAARSFRYAVAATPGNVPSEQDAAIDLNDRRQHGYRLADTLDATPRAASPILPPGYHQALLGTDADLRQITLPGGGRVVASSAGCEAQSRERLYGSLASWAEVNYLPQRLSLKLAAKARTDPTFTAALKRWQDCMSARGYRYTSPDDAVQQLTAGYRTSGVTPAARQHEIAVAVADAGCEQRLHLPDIALDLRRRYARALPVTDRERLEAVTTLWSAAVARAEP